MNIFISRKSETPFHYALRGPKEVRALVFETLMKEFKGSDLKTFLKMKVCYGLSSSRKVCLSFDQQ
jgi:hypothetical protein